MTRDLLNRYTAVLIYQVDCVADEQTGEVARFSSAQSAALAATKLETGNVTRDTYRWHRDPRVDQ